MSETRIKINLPSDADISGRSFGEEEMENLRRVIASGTRRLVGDLFDYREEDEMLVLGASATPTAASETTPPSSA